MAREEADLGLGSCQNRRLLGLKGRNPQGEEVVLAELKGEGEVVVNAVDQGEGAEADSVVGVAVGDSVAGAIVGGDSVAGVVVGSPPVEAVVEDLPLVVVVGVDCMISFGNASVSSRLRYFALFVQ